MKGSGPDSADYLLPPSLVRSVGDKLYEKRKSAALEVEQIVKTLVQAGAKDRIRALINKLTHDFAYSPQANHRKGGLLCLAAVAVAVGDDNGDYLDRVVPPVLAAFTDPDSRVRYYACEALYNVVKVAREAFMTLFFNEAFDALFKLCADSSADVQSATTVLDNLVKEIVTASPTFDVNRFIPVLKTCMLVVNPHKRQFLINWISVLESVPDIEMLRYLPELLDGLFTMLSDNNREIRHTATKALQSFLLQIRATKEVAFVELVHTLVDKARCTDHLTRLTALKWLTVFTDEVRGDLTPLAADVLAVVLPCLADSDTEIAEAAAKANAALRGLDLSGGGGDGGVDAAGLLKVVAGELAGEQEASRLEALRWVNLLLTKHKAQAVEQLQVLLPSLLDACSAQSEEVALEALAAHALIAKEERHFTSVLEFLVDRFRAADGPGLLQQRGPLIVRRLCALLGAHRVYVTLAGILDAEPDLRFASMSVQALNLILLTAPELRGLREQLQRAAAAPADLEAVATLTALYPCWRHSAAAMLSLCFLSQAYNHAARIVHSFADIPLGLEVLIQLDRLVALLETPMFTFLRLHLLSPATHPHLIKALYGLLMLLPQSPAFRTLHARLHSVPTAALLQLDGLHPGEPGGGGEVSATNSEIPWSEMLTSFIERQMEHAQLEDEASSLSRTAAVSTSQQQLAQALSGVDAARIPPQAG